MGSNKETMMLRNIWCLPLYIEAFSTANPQSFYRKSGCLQPCPAHRVQLVALRGHHVSEAQALLVLPRAVQHRVQQKAHHGQAQLPQQDHLVRSLWVLLGVLTTANNILVLRKSTFNRQLSTTTQLVLSETENWPKQPGVDCQIWSVW